ncbi:protein disulfide isomeraseplus ER retention motif [Cryptosporidium ryanae]|uniref:protein disulfide isomeraseplus ER retention motif n=1 Tax=Cryptosporidium ryanae TaxID=515981 RepID=UPI00351A7604|nr:protein disulfide isomeraseplus ER retention motif [Cryptosporidium ryanae]
MRFLKLLLILFTLCVASNCNVIELDKNSFSKFLGENDHCIVLFYSEDCTACATVIEKLDKLHLEFMNINVSLGKINGERNLKLLEEYQINDFPTLKFFRKKVPEEYYGGKEDLEILEWTKEQISYPIRMIENKLNITKNNIVNFLENDDVIYVLYGTKNSSEYNVFYDVADFNRLSGKFYFVSSELIPNLTENNFVGIYNGSLDIDSVLTSNNDSKNKHNNWLLCLRKYENNGIIFNKSLKNRGDVFEFVKSNHVPLFGEISSKNFAKYSDIDLDLIWLLVPMENGKGNQSIKPYISIFTKISQEFSSTYRVVWLDTSEHSKHLSTVLLVEPEMLPTVAIAKTRPYILPPNTPIEYSTIKQFINDVDSGKIEPKLRSEPIPLYNEDDKFTKIVGINFNSIVLDDNINDWIVLLTTPFCQPCIDTEEILNKLNDALVIQGNSKIKFGIIDISENDLPKDEYYSDSIPSLLFFNKNNSNPSKFNADEISYVNIKEYIVNSTSIEVKNLSFNDPENYNELVVTIFPEFEQFSDEPPTQEQIELVEKSLKHDEL